jgi:hypothetical protein
MMNGPLEESAGGGGGDDAEWGRLWSYCPHYLRIMLLLPSD